MEVQSLGQEDPLEKGIATHSSILARRTPWTEKPGRDCDQQGCKESDMTEDNLTCTHMYEIFTNIYESMDSIFDYFVPLNHLCNPVSTPH